MKTIFITVCESLVARNLLRGPFWKFMTVPGHRIVLLVSADKEEAYRKEFGGERVLVEAMPRIRPGSLERIISFWARNGLHTGTVTFNQMRAYHRRPDLILLLIKRFVWLVGGIRPLVWLLRRFELSIPPHPGLRELYEKYHPDLVFASVSIDTDVDVPVLREAKRRGIRTVGGFRGWDNLTSHGILRVVPDYILLQDEYLKVVGREHHFLPENTIEITGFPANDWYFRTELRESREQFFARLGIDPQKRLVLFGAMGDYLFPDEGDLADVFEELIESGKLPSDVVVVYRAHPKYRSPLAKVKTMQHVIPDSATEYGAEGPASDEMRQQEMAHLINSIIHSDVVTTSGSTIALDAVAFDKPTVSICFEKKKLPYWLSAARFRDAYTHYEAMMATGGVARADTPEALADAINEYLAHPEKDAERRTETRRLFLEPNDGHAGERIAKAVLAKI